MKTEPQDTASFDGQFLRGIRNYDWPQPHSEEFVLQVCDPKAERCRYWAAINGHCYPFEVVTGETCIANVQSLLYQAIGNGCNYGDVYVIWQPKSHTTAVWDKWERKWSVRTKPQLQTCEG